VAFLGISDTKKRIDIATLIWHIRKPFTEKAPLLKSGFILIGPVTNNYSAANETNLCDVQDFPFLS